MHPELISPDPCRYLEIPPGLDQGGSLRRSGDSPSARELSTAFAARTTSGRLVVVSPPAPENGKLMRRYAHHPSNVPVGRISTFWAMSPMRYKSPSCGAAGSGLSGEDVDVTREPRAIPSARYITEWYLGDPKHPSGSPDDAGTVMSTVSSILPGPTEDVREELG